MISLSDPREIVDEYVIDVMNRNQYCYYKMLCITYVDILSLKARGRTEEPTHRGAMEHMAGTVDLTMTNHPNFKIEHRS